MARSLRVAGTAVAVVSLIAVAMIVGSLAGAFPIGNSTPAQASRSPGASSSGLRTAYNWGQLGVAAGSGCLAGGLVGAAAGAGVGAGIGCPVGAAIAALADGWYQAASQSAEATRELNFISQLLQSTLNQWNETSALVNTIFSVLNQTEYYLYSMADAAALSQLGNTTFNPGLALAQTPIPYMMTTLLDVAEYGFGLAWQYNQNVMQSEYCGTCYYGASASYNEYTGYASVVGSAECAGAAACGARSYTVAGLDNYNSAAGQYLYIADGANFTLTCSSTGASSLSSVDGVAPPISYGASTLWEYNWTEPSDVYYMPNTGSCAVSGIGIFPFASSGTISTSSRHSLIGECSNTGAVNCDPMTTADPVPYSLSGENFIATGATGSGIVSTSPVAGAPYGTADAFNALANGNNAIQSLVDGAIANARVYWTFLRGAGYTSESQIPANCVIPMPAFSLPPAIADNQGNQTNSTQAVSEDLGIYLSWLNGAATFFDAPPDAANFCQGHPQWGGPGTSPFENPALNLTGFIYVPGKAWSSTQTLVNSSVPVLATRSTWTFNGSSPAPVNVTAKGNASRPIELTGWPTLASVSIPIGSVYEVPSNDPLIIIPTSYFAYLLLSGNGSPVKLGGSATELSALQPGDALYITTCTDNGVVETGNCTLTFQTINGYYGNESCGAAPGGACNNPAPSGAGFFGGLDVCGWPLISTLCSVFGGSLVSGIVSLILLLLVVVIVIWVVLAVVGRRSSGGGGSTILVAGGRR